MGSCGAYVSAKVSFDQPIFDVWLASTLYRYVSQDGQIQTGKELTQVSLACIPAYDGHNGPSWSTQNRPVYMHGHTNYTDLNLCRALSEMHRKQTEPEYKLVIRCLESWTNTLPFSNCYFVSSQCLHGRPTCNGHGANEGRLQ